MSSCQECASLEWINKVWCSYYRTPKTGFLSLNAIRKSSELERKQAEFIGEITCRQENQQEKGASLSRGVACKASKDIFLRSEGLGVGEVSRSPTVMTMWSLIFSGHKTIIGCPSSWSTLLGLRKNRNACASVLSIILIFLRQPLLPYDCSLLCVCFPRKRYLSLRFWKPLTPASNQWLYRRLSPSCFCLCCLRPMRLNIIQPLKEMKFWCMLQHQQALNTTRSVKEVLQTTYCRTPFIWNVQIDPQWLVWDWGGGMRHDC